MKNQSFTRQLKLARKNAQREIDLCKKALKEGRYGDFRTEAEICLKYSYPLRLYCKYLYYFDMMIKLSSRHKSLGRVAKAIFRKGRVIDYSKAILFFVDNKKDLRELGSITYNLTGEDRKSVV